MKATQGSKSWLWLTVQVWAIMKGKSRQQELKAAGPITSLAKKKRTTNVCAHLPFSFSYRSESHPRDGVANF